MLFTVDRLTEASSVCVAVLFFHGNSKNLRNNATLKGCNSSVAYDMFGTLPLFSSTVSCMDYALMHMILAPCSFTQATFAIMKQVLFVLYFALSVSALSNAFNVDDRIIARWTNNLYYPGKVLSLGNGQVNVLFDDNDSIIHRISDVSAVIPDKVPHDVAIGHHVVATWKGGNKYFIGYVSDKDSGNRVKVTFDDNDEDFYIVSQLRIFPDHWSTHEVGARVFARWTNGLYYRGFVTSSTSTTVFINYDDGDTITLPKIDSTAVILDHPACYSEVQAGQRVIGFWPGRTRYYPGVVTRKMISDSNNCYQKAVYDVLFDDADKRLQDSLQIRLIPCTASQELNVKSI
ncbi:uncharacterized protein [Montipora capricornis]|uniref:uncharacterized protein isoform X2 n=1 Tax=Montipora foliosa TaxID=591990 RepID=UPI0035F14675